MRIKVSSADEKPITVRVITKKNPNFVNWVRRGAK